MAEARQLGKLTRSLIAPSDGVTGLGVAYPETDDSAASARTLDRAHLYWPDCISGHSVFFCLESGKPFLAVAATLLSASSRGGRARLCRVATASFYNVESDRDRPVGSPLPLAHCMGSVTLFQMQAQI